MHDMLRVLEPIWRSKTETAARLRGRIEAVLSWATVAGHRAGENPARWKRQSVRDAGRSPPRSRRPTTKPALALTDARGWWGDLARREGMAAQALRFLSTDCRPFG